MIKRISLAALAAPLALAVAACGSDEAAETGSLESEPIAPIAAPGDAQWAETVTETPEGGFLIGNPEAPVELLGYASHTCPHCATFAAESAAGIEEYVNTGVVSYEMRNQIHDPLDLTIAMLTRCGPAESFHPLANQAWANLNQIIQSAQENGEALNQAIQAPAEERYQRIAEAAGLIDFFAARGISRDQAMQCLAQPEEAEQIVEQSQSQSEELGVTGTPFFFLNGNPVNVGTWEALEPMLQQAGAR